jgi:hypothetical protein
MIGSLMDIDFGSFVELLSEEEMHPQLICKKNIHQMLAEL